MKATVPASDDHPEHAAGTPPSFVRALISNVAGLALVLGLVLLLAMLWQGLASTRDAARQDIGETLDRASERLRILLHAAEMTAESAERTARTPTIDSTTLRPALERSLAAFEQRPELSYVGIVLPATGEYGSLERTDAGQIRLWLFPGTRREDRVTRNFALTERGFVLQEERPADGYDARTRPFYRAALDGPPGGLWMPAYAWIVHFDEHSAPLWGFSYVKPVRDADGRLIGVLDTDFDMPALNRYLAALAAEYHVDLQVVELGTSPRLIGGDGVQRAPLPVPAALAPLLRLGADDSFVGRMQLGGEQRWSAARRITLSGGLSWLVVASRKDALIAAPLRHQLYQVAGLGLAAAIGLVLVLAQMARRFGRPLAALERRVAGLGRHGLEAPEPASTPASIGFRETRLLDEALDRMTAAMRRREHELQHERDYADAILNSLPGVFYHYDEQLRLQRWNRNLERISGYSAAELAGVGPEIFFADKEKARVAAGIARLFERGEAAIEADYRLKDGRRIPYLFTGTCFEHDGGRGFVGVGTDISERKQAEQRLRHLATHDTLTGLPNRNLIQERTEQAIARARAGGGTLALLYLGLDRFKVINDGYGHPFGDAVLKAVGERLAGLVGAEGSVARHGSDEFLVLLPDLPGDADARVAAAAGRIIACLAQPLVVRERTVHLTCSIGASVYPHGGDGADALIGSANVAMYRAKDLGRNAFQPFTEQIREETRRRIALETWLHDAVDAGQLRLLYQPKVDLESGRITGCEALLRWQHPELGEVPPGRFVPIAEDSGLIVPIGDWVLRSACAQAKAWLQAGLPPVCVAVNLSARQFLQQDVEAWVLRTLRETGLPPAQLELELTESLIARDVEKVIATINRLKAAGVHLSIDDFGTGYSSLGYLKRFRVDTLKIDQSFIRNLFTEPRDATITLAVIALARSLDFKVIAEGVETARHCDFLREHGCNEIQGYYFSRPVPAPEFEAMLREGRRLA